MGEDTGVRHVTVGRRRVWASSDQNTRAADSPPEQDEAPSILGYGGGFVV
jgi:hypothetical protein